MSFNYTNLRNQSLENMLPIFGALAGSSSTAMTNHSNFINHLAAVMNTTPIGGVNSKTTISSSSTTSTNTNTSTKRDRTPEPPPAPKFSTSPPKVRPNQGTAPMDIENDSEPETVSTSTSPTTTGTTSTTTAKLADKLPFNMAEANMFLNSFMPAGLNAATAGYMFFPTAPTATTPSTQTGSMLMDPATMMAAMQQMQQTYTGYHTLAEGTVDGSNQSGVGINPELYTAPGMKEVIKTKSCTLFPPNPTAPPPTIRERPPGCRTVFVGGLPENITEEIIREIFETCGEITTLRMSKKNFCHIRYRHETSIDRAIYLSGYRVRISNVNDPANFGRLHVDYAQARDDQYDYECKQRQLQREQRHRERVSLDRIRSQSPPPVPHYTDHEASLVAESLRNNDTFIKAIQTITLWLERGDCTKRNANAFYSMIQSTHAHVRRLYTDKQQLEEELRKARESYRKQMLTMSTQCK